MKQRKKETFQKIRQEVTESDVPMKKMDYNIVLFMEPQNARTERSLKPENEA